MVEFNRCTKCVGKNSRNVYILTYIYESYTLKLYRYHCCAFGWTTSAAGLASPEPWPPGCGWRVGMNWKTNDFSTSAGAYCKVDHGEQDNLLEFFAPLNLICQSAKFARICRCVICNYAINRRLHMNLG